MQPLTWRFAENADCAQLAAWNHQLIRDEGHRNTMDVAALETRMRGFLAGEYRAVIFSAENTAVAYALFRESDSEIYLRQLFVIRERRREGIGRRAVGILRGEVWPSTKRLTIEVLTANARAVAFWRAMGYVDYCLTLEILPSV